MVAMKKYWFKSKRYGWGWTPSTWQGWLIMFAALAVIVINAINIDRGSHSVSDTLIGASVPTVLVVAVLILICFLTGEKPRWRWGGKD